MSGWNSVLVVTWHALSHEVLVGSLLPNLNNPGRGVFHSKKYNVNHQMHLKNSARFHWPSGTHSELFHYIQSYTTEKTISYQLHVRIFSQWKA